MFATPGKPEEIANTNPGTPEAPVTTNHGTPAASAISEINEDKFFDFDDANQNIIKTTPETPETPETPDYCVVPIGKYLCRANEEARQTWKSDYVWFGPQTSVNNDYSKLPQYRAVVAMNFKRELKLIVLRDMNHFEFLKTKIDDDNLFKGTFLDATNSTILRTSDKTNDNDVVQKILTRFPEFDGIIEPKRLSEGGQITFPQELAVRRTVLESHIDKFCVLSYSKSYCKPVEAVSKRSYSVFADAGAGKNLASTMFANLGGGHNKGRRIHSGVSTRRRKRRAQSRRLSSTSTTRKARRATATRTRGVRTRARWCPLKEPLHRK